MVIDSHNAPVDIFDAIQGSYWTPHRRELAQWFKDQAPSFLEGYIGAVKLLHTPAFPARVNFICHAVRDVYRWLPASLGEKSLPRPGEVFPNMVVKLRGQWKKFPPKQTETADIERTDFMVSSQVYDCVKDIVKKSHDIVEQPTVGKQLAIALFRSLDRRKDEFIYPWIIDSFNTEYKFFMGRAHFPTSIDKVLSDDGLIEHFESFERSFHSLIGPYFSGKEELDAILQDTNPNTD